MTAIKDNLPTMSEVLCSLALAGLVIAFIAVVVGR